MKKSELKKEIRERILEKKCKTADIDEMSTSGGAGAYNTPYAFKLKKKDSVNERLGVSSIAKSLKEFQLSEATVDYNFSKEELIRVIKQLKRGASTEVGMIKAFTKALGRELTDDEIRGYKLNEELGVSKDKLSNIVKFVGAVNFTQMIISLRDENVQDEIVSAFEDQYPAVMDKRDDLQEVEESIFDTPRMGGYHNSKGVAGHTANTHKQDKEYADSNRKAREKAMGKKKDKDLSEALNGDQQEALMDLQNILDQAAQLGDEARSIIQDTFPEELRGAEAYDVFNFGSSSNSYDNTLESLISDIERRFSEDEGDDLDENMDKYSYDSIIGPLQKNMVYMDQYIGEHGNPEERKKFRTLKFALEDFDEYMSYGNTLEK